MRAVVLEQFGDPAGMRVVERDVPTPAPGQVLVRAEAVAVGGVDAMIRRGALGAAATAGMVPGSEVAGVVVAVGPQVDPSWTGRRVWAFTGTSGAYAEHATARVDDLTVIPSGLSSVQAVTVGSAATVAHFALAHAHLAAGDPVLVRGAAGSIGIAAVELATRAGARLVAVTTSSAERGERLRVLGATHVLDRSGAGDPTMPGTVDVVLDMVGGVNVPVFLDRLAPNGRYVLVGAVAGFPPADLALTLLRSFQQSRSSPPSAWRPCPSPTGTGRARRLLRAAADGDLTPVVDAVLPLEDAAEAHRRMDRGTVLGRIVLVPRPH